MTSTGISTLIDVATDLRTDLTTNGEIKSQQMNGEIEEEKVIEISPVRNYPSLTLQQSAPSNESQSATNSTLHLTDLTFSEFNSKQKSYRKSFLRMFNELMNTNERRAAYFICFLTICCGALRLIFFIFMGSIIDLLANTYNKNLHKICNIHKYITCTTNESLIHVFVITLIIVAVAASLFRYAQSILTSFCACSFLKRLNCQTFEKLINQNLAFFDMRTKSDLRYLLTNDMKSVSMCLFHSVTIIESIVHFLCGIIYVFLVNRDIALIIIGSFLILTIISLLYIKKSNVVYQIRKQAFGFVVASVVEMLSYITTIKTFSKEDDESFIYNVCIDRAFENESKKNAYSYGYRFWMSIMMYFTILAIIWYGAFVILDTNTNQTVGTLVVDLFILLHINFCIYQIVHLLPLVIVRSGKSLTRILKIWDLKGNEKKNKRNSNNNYIPRDYHLKGKIEMRNVCFSYPKRKNKMILNDISLTFLPSSANVIVGISGSGKSTIFKLLMRFFEFKIGEILIDDINIKDYNLPFLLSQIGYVSHNVNLFENRSIGDNIKFGMKLDRKHHYLFDVEYFDEESMYFWRIFKSITQNEVEKAAKLANAHEFIMNLEKGYDTIIGGETGTRLSHGQKQRIGIARALLLDPKIILLDEAMSGIDRISKQLIMEALEKIKIGRCVIVIAHRLKTVQKAQNVYVLNNGKMVGNGSHTELLDSGNEIYSELTNRHLTLRDDNMPVLDEEDTNIIDASQNNLDVPHAHF